MRSNTRERTHFLLVNLLSSHQHIFCATGMSSGLETKVLLPQVPRGLLHGSVKQYVVAVRLRFVRYILFTSSLLIRKLCNLAALNFE
jgi:hypothetical protein